MRLLSPSSGFLTGAALKALACLFMVIDHVGYLFFPETVWLRAVGRLAMPIFAFFIAEGCRYTKNKLRYFLQVFLLGLICLLVYYFYDDTLMGNILITFSGSIALIYLLQLVKKHLFGLRKPLPALLYGIAFLLALDVMHRISILLAVDYGFTGMLVPVWVAAFDFKDYEAYRHWDTPVYKLFALFVGLILLIDGNSLQSYCLLSLPLLACYNGKPGWRAMKYGFYLFYPLHLLLLQGLYLLLNA